MINLTHHLLSQHSYSQEAREIAEIINQIVLGAKVISREVNRAGLVDILGSTNRANTTGDEVQRLDEITNNLFTRLFEQSPQVGAYASEELDKPVFFPEHGSSGQYAAILDPIDGSSNIDVNVSVGTIFGIFKRPKTGKRSSLKIKLDESIFFQPGSALKAAGYVVYGSSTMLVYSTGQGVHGFTLDQSLGEFLLSHPHLKFPKHGTIYSINESYTPNWNEAFQKYIASLKTDQDISGKPKNARYIGSLVSDFHRNLLKGGIYLYPADAKHPEGKLRLLFEGIPLGFIAHQAGGAASDGRRDILNITPTKLHQKTPLFVGNEEDVKKSASYGNAF